MTFNRKKTKAATRSKRKKKLNKPKQGDKESEDVAAAGESLTVQIVLSAAAVRWIKHMD